WDRGTYENLVTGRSVREALANGRLEFVLHGDKLRSRFTLVRMKGRGAKNWLLIKGRDEFARAEPEGHPKSASRLTPKRSKRPAVAATAEAPPNEVEVTHPEKVLFPDAGITKGDVFAYYRKVARRLLPYLRDRPVTLERLPDGLGPGKPHFWQKNPPA